MLSFIVELTSIKLLFQLNAFSLKTIIFEEHHTLKG